MRTGLPVLMFLAATIAPAAAHPTFSPAAPNPEQRNFASDRPTARIELPSANTFLARNVRREDTEGLTLESGHISAPPESSTGPSIDVGSFHAEIGGTGTHAHLAHYTLMNGAVSGSIDGKSAQIAIHW